MTKETQSGEVLVRKNHKTMTRKEWIAEASILFGADSMAWRFVCPSCTHAASVKDWKDAGAAEGEVAFSCVGRHLKADDKNTFKRSGGPCQYAGGGLFAINPITVIDEGGIEHHVFDFDRSSKAEGLDEVGEQVLRPSSDGATP